MKKWIWLLVLSLILDGCATQSHDSGSLSDMSQDVGASVGRGPSSWSAPSTALTTNDIVPITKVDDTTQSPQGSSRKTTFAEIKTLMGKDVAFKLGAATDLQSPDGTKLIDDTSADSNHVFSAAKVIALAGSAAMGYVETPPTYADDACNKGQYAFDTTKWYFCKTTGGSGTGVQQWDYFTISPATWTSYSTPSLTSFTIDSTGLIGTAVFNRSVQNGSGGAAGWAMSSPTHTLTYSSGSGTNTLIYAINSPAIDSTMTPTVAYTQPGNGVEGILHGTDVASFTGFGVTNQSSVLPVDTTPPTLTTSTISADGTTWTHVFSEAVTATSTADLCNAFAVTMSTAGAVTQAYASGNNSGTIICTGSPTVNINETVLSGENYTQGTIKDLSANNNLLANISNHAVVNNSSQGGVTYLTKQGFEGTGYDNSETWVTLSGTPDPDYTTTVLEGSQSMFMNSLGQSTSVEKSHVVTTSDEVWGYFLLRVTGNNLTNNSSLNLIVLYNNTTTVARVQLYSQGSGNPFKLRVYNGTSASATTTNTLNLNTTYHIWFHYAKGTGANGVADVAFSTDGTKPTSGNAFSSTSIGTSTSAVTKMSLVAGYSNPYGLSVIFDKVRLDDVSIGDNPQ